jgi:hypothetical protein
MKSEIRNPKSEKSPQAEGRILRANEVFSGFGFRVSDFARVQSTVDTDGSVQFTNALEQI